MFFVQRIDWPSQRAQPPTSEITNDVFSAVWHQQTDNIAFGYALRRQQSRRAINCCRKFRIGESPAIRLGKQKCLVWGTGGALCKQIADVTRFAGHGSKHCNFECAGKRSGTPLTGAQTPHAGWPRGDPGPLPVLSSSSN